MVRLKLLVVVLAVGMVLSVARILMLNGLPVVESGVPLRTPLVNDMPGGSDWPLGLRSKVTGFVPPVAVKVTEYVLFTMPDGKGVPLVIVNWPNAGAAQAARIQTRAFIIYLGGPKLDPPAEMEVPDGVVGEFVLLPPRVTPTATPAAAPPRIATRRAVFPPPPPDFCGAALVWLSAMRTVCPACTALTRIWN